MFIILSITKILLFITSIVYLDLQNFLPEELSTRFKFSVINKINKVVAIMVSA